MIATLVVQPPSSHEGGDLIVYRGEEVEHRHDFGKCCLFTTYYLNAEHALEKVTKGFRLALVYSICLPVSNRYLRRDPNRTMSNELANVVNGMEPDDEPLTLLLSQDYTKKSIEAFGMGSEKS
ncbi:hypothetical protein PC129_g10464 [Phytophthora cactorum]|uniref:Prolyl 4-hydroxylase alpha subunit Fe(2+) 2OG dioxygenase domain-containing protein n=1 Tax=Phytophthora cactorum TaxID=29920 RepID=A0A329SM85_9STRA|nr:hypothetical protein Pcac1_g6249 [Phytophthora cactorum]KAG2818207.1 hypothetical protein PC111_g12398 [Phytophthora cactorum]KAG2819919.1 hypothetical protein PC112_g11982 [Phytophthora cactorum]KAG2854325.1 hypothetical protein PC113_g13399 [Phytophthora cactorum]KAG2899230.1 hypothetical protein PC114_g13994 [Phytophthora cactorum]